MTSFCYIDSRYTAANPAPGFHFDGFTSQRKGHLIESRRWLQVYSFIEELCVNVCCVCVCLKQWRWDYINCGGPLFLSWTGWTYRTVVQGKGNNNIVGPSWGDFSYSKFVELSSSLLFCGLEVVRPMLIRLSSVGGWRDRERVGLWRDRKKDRQTEWGVGMEGWKGVTNREYTVEQERHDCHVTHRMAFTCRKFGAPLLCRRSRRTRRKHSSLIYPLFSRSVTELCPWIIRDYKKTPIKIGSCAEIISCDCDASQLWWSLYRHYHHIPVAYCPSDGWMIVVDYGEI